MAKEIKKEVELDEEEALVPVDKVADAGDATEDGEVDSEALADDGGLDDTELDPFKDKWEE